MIICQTVKKQAKMNKKVNHNLYTNTLAFLFCLAIFGLFWWMLNATTVFASDPLTYTLLAELPGIDPTPTHGNYLSGMVKLIIGLTTALAVLMMVYAGVFGYIGGATNQSSRSAAKERMWGALLGLTLALVSYIILNTINPDLLSLDLTVSDIPAATP